MNAQADFQVRHRTHYRYSAPVAVCQNQIRMRPRNLPSVQVRRTRTSISPQPDTRETYDDYFGNVVETFSIEALHEELIVEVVSNLTVDPITITDPSRMVTWQSVADAVRTPAVSNLLSVGEFSLESPRIPIGRRYREYALESFRDEPSIVDASIDLTKRIRQDFKYDTNATHVDTTVASAFGLRAGVCQDFAHIQIACLRSLGVPARYVSGYLRTLPPPGEKKMVGADESHAWVSVYIDDQIGWLGLDPTNGCVIGRDHIPICFGRDYPDVSPMRGVAIGGGQADLTVSVDVKETPRV